jgi:hypothetical protein
MRRLSRTLPLSLVLMLALAGLGLILTACNNGSQSQIRFVHAIYDAGQLDIEFNGTKEVTDINFGGVQPTSGYRAVPSGSDTVEGFQTGTTVEAFSTSNVNLSSGSVYTVVATGNIAAVGNAVILAEADDNAEPANGTINFRIINAAPNSPSTVDIYLVQTPLQGSACQGTATTTLSYQGASNYINLPYNTNGEGYTMYVCVGGSLQFSGFVISGGSLNAGSIRTVILTDEANVQEMDPQPIVLNDLN